MMDLMDFSVIKLLKRWFSTFTSNITKEDCELMPIMPIKKRGRKPKIKVLKEEIAQELGQKEV